MWGFLRLRLESPQRTLPKRTHHLPQMAGRHNSTERGLGVPVDAEGEWASHTVGWKVTHCVKKWYHRRSLPGETVSPDSPPRCLVRKRDRARARHGANHRSHTRGRHCFSSTHFFPPWGDQTWQMWMMRKKKRSYPGHLSLWECSISPPTTHKLYHRILTAATHAAPEHAGRLSFPISLAVNLHSDAYLLVNRLQVRVMWASPQSLLLDAPLCLLLQEWAGFPGEGNGSPLQYSGLENSMDCIVHEVTKSWTDWATFAFTFQEWSWRK